MIVLLAILRIAVRVVLCLLLADFLAGAVHWLEDSYGQVDWPLVGRTVIAPNLLHHAEPRAFLVNTWWRSADYQVMVAGLALGGAALLGWFTWELVVVLGVAANANEVHKWSHRTRAENGRVISLLQDCKLVQSRAHHGRHHGGDRNTHYCSVTPWLNPVLERARFWRAAEWLIARVTGATPRLDPVVVARRVRVAAAR
jgi:ubiquitin-conjugating enzyme E2 variant